MLVNQGANARSLSFPALLLFFFIRPRRLSRTDRSGCQRAPLPLPASLPPPHPFSPGAVCLQAIGSRRRQSRCLSGPGRRFTKWACIERWVPSPDWPSPLPIKRGRRAPAEPQSASRPAHRSARRLVAGRGKGARPPPCPAGGWWWWWRQEVPVCSRDYITASQSGSAELASWWREGGALCTSRARGRGGGCWGGRLVRGRLSFLPQWRRGTEVAWSAAYPVRRRGSSAVARIRGRAVPRGCPGEASPGGLFGRWARGERTEHRSGAADSPPPGK